MLKQLIAGAVAAFLFAPVAQAAVHVLDLGGDVSTLLSGSFPTPSGLVEFGSLQLTGFGSLMLAEGDTLSFTISLVNGPLTIPGRPDMLLGLDFDPVSPPGADPWLSGSFLFDNGFAGGGACSNCLAVITGLPSGADFSFSFVSGSALVEILDAPTEIGSVRLTYQLITPVPEPGTWARMIGGFGLVGGALRRRVAATA